MALTPAALSDAGVKQPELCPTLDRTRPLGQEGARAAGLEDVAARSARELFEACAAHVERCRSSGTAAARIAVPALGDGWDDASPAEMLRFLHALRAAVHGTRVCALVTIPAGALPNFAPAAHLADAVVELDALPPAPCDVDAMLPDQHAAVGLLRVTRVTQPGALAPPQGCLDRVYALEAHRKRLAVTALVQRPEEDERGAEARASEW